MRISHDRNHRLLQHHSFIQWHLRKHKKRDLNIIIIAQVNILSVCYIQYKLQCQLHAAFSRHQYQYQSQLNFLTLFFIIVQLLVCFNDKKTFSFSNNMNLVQKRPVILFGWWNLFLRLRFFINVNGLYVLHFLLKTYNVLRIF